MYSKTHLKLQNDNAVRNEHNKALKDGAWLLADRIADANPDLFKAKVYRKSDVLRSETITCVDGTRVGGYDAESQN